MYENQLQQQVALLEAIPVLPKDEILNEEALREAEQRLPAHIRKFIRDRFGNDEEADSIVHSYHFDETVRKKVDGLYERSRVRLEKMVELHQPLDAFEEQPSS